MGTEADGQCNDISLISLGSHAKNKESLDLFLFKLIDFLVRQRTMKLYIISMFGIATPLLPKSV